MKNISNKISAVSLILMIMVIYLHSYNIHTIKKFDDPIYNLSNFLQNLLSQGVFRIAVPMFFIISGFLFFRNYKDISDYISKIKNRIKSILIPFIFWNLIVILIYYIFQLFLLKSFSFNSILIKDLGFWGILNSIFVNPYNYPLWFLRDLMFVILLSPIIHIFILKIPKKFISLLLLLWFIDIGGGANFYFFKSEVILFFSIGCYLSIYNINITNRINFKSFIYLLIFYIVLINFKTYLFVIGEGNTTTESLILHKISILIGIYIFWYSSDYKWLDKFHLLKFTFLLYVFHEPLLSFSKKIGFIILGNNSISSLILYFITPIFVIIILYLLGSFFKKYFPKLIYFMSGGRI